jgi:hypothetical protein
VTPKTRSLSAGERVWHVGAAVLLLGYGGAGVYYDDLYIPGKHSRGVHLHGLPAWIMFGAFVFASLNLLSVLADHCDQSDTGRMYHIFARVTQVAGWALFIGAFVFSLFPPRQNHW